MANQSEFYQDTYITCDARGLTVRWYYFPVGDKFIAYDAIQAFEKIELGFEGKWRIWGMGLAPYWFHLDPGRPKKDNGIMINEGQPIKVVITPDDVEAVMAILQAQTRLASS